MNPDDGGRYAMVGAVHASEDRWSQRKPDRVLSALRRRDRRVAGYEELCALDTDEFRITTYTRRLTPLGCALQIFDNHAFVECQPEDVTGYLRCYTTETIDALGETPTSYFYLLYKNSGPHFELIARRVLQFHAEHSSPFEPRNETLVGLYGDTRSAMMHVTEAVLREDWRGQRRLAGLVAAVETVLTDAARYSLNPDNPFHRDTAPDEDTIERWRARYEEELAVQLSRRLSYLSLSEPEHDNPRFSTYLETVLIDLANDRRPVELIEAA